MQVENMKSSNGNKVANQFTKEKTCILLIAKSRYENSDS